MPERIQLRRTKGWRLLSGAVFVARPSKWGNPFRIVPNEDIIGYHLSDDGEISGFFPDLATARAAAVEEFRDLMALKLQYPGTNYPDPRELRGLDLACWCPLDEPCHADVLLEIANQ